MDIDDFVTIAMTAITTGALLLWIGAEIMRWRRESRARKDTPEAASEVPQTPTQDAPQTSDDILLELRFGDGQHEILKFPAAAEISIGRADPSTTFKPSLDLTQYGAKRQGVSRLHATIRRDGPHLYLSDRGSLNGTFVNGNRLEMDKRHVLTEGDYIGLGALKIYVTFPLAQAAHHDRRPPAVARPSILEALSRRITRLERDVDSLDDGQIAELERLKSETILEGARQIDDAIQHDRWTEAMGVIENLLQDLPDSAILYLSRGLVRRKQGDPRDAIVDLNQAIEIDPRLASAYYNRGNAYYNLGKQKRALADYERALQIDPTFAAAFYNRGIVYAEQGKWAQAIDNFTQTISHDPEHATAHSNRGLALVERGRLHEAVIEFTRAIEINPTLALAYTNRGNAYHRQGATDQAMADYNEAIRIDPRYAAAYLNRGIARTRQGQLPQAIVDFTQAIQIDSGLAAAYYHRGCAHEDQDQANQALPDFTRAAQLESPYADAYFERVTLRARAEGWDPAITRFNQAIAIDPGFALGYTCRGRAHLELDALDMALDDFNRAIELDPGDAAAYAYRGGAYLSQGDFEKVIADCTHAVEIEPQLAIAYFNRGRAHSEQKQWDEANADFSRTIQINPNYAMAYYHRGEVYAEQNELANALADFNRAIALDPRHAEGYLSRGYVYLKQRQWRPAFDDFTKAVLIDPHSAKAYVYRGYAAANMHDLVSAISQYNMAIEVDPDYALAYHYRGNIHAFQGDLDQAIADQDKAIELDPTYIDAYLFRGQAYNRQKQWDKAIADYDKVVELDPEQVSAHYERGLVALHISDLALALKSFQYLKDAKPKSFHSYIALAEVYRRMGDQSTFEEYVTQARQHLTTLPFSPYALARLESVAGNIEEALHYLQQAVTESTFDRAWAELDPLLANARQDRRFRDTIRGKRNVPRPAPPPSSPGPEVPSPNDTLSHRYQIVSTVHRGSTGVVYKAHSTAFTYVMRLCAIKEMTSLIPDRHFRRRRIHLFERQAELLATLNHPAIPRIYDHFSLADHAYLVMEYIEGHNLWAILSERSNLSVEHIRQWGIEICRALNYLHDQPAGPILFRAMQPSSVMIDLHGHVRLVDFGIGTHYQNAKRATTAVAPAYAAPELQTGWPSISTDIYALGALLHHLLTRHDPRTEPLFSFEQRPIQELNPDVPQPLADAVMRAIARDPADRYASVNEMQRALESIGEDEGQAAPASAALPAPYWLPARKPPDVARVGGMLHPGQVLHGRFDILSVIGMGGTGVVYQARDRRFNHVDRQCAIKEMINLAPQGALQEDSLHNFRRDAEVLAMLNHPAIPRIHDFFILGDRAYLVQDLVDGIDLGTLLNSTSALLPAEEVRRWGVEICATLDYLHRCQPDPIAFRAIKPSSVMIGHDRHVRLVDFGLGRHFQIGVQSTMAAPEGYAPPEEYVGYSSPSADLYALGALLHHLLTRRDPRHEAPFSFAQRSIREINAQVSDEFVGVVMRALAYDPENRFASAVDMMQALDTAGPGRASSFVPREIPSAVITPSKRSFGED